MNARDARRLADDPDLASAYKLVHSLIADRARAGHTSLQFDARYAPDLAHAITVMLKSDGYTVSREPGMPFVISW